MTSLRALLLLIGLAVLLAIAAPAVANHLGSIAHTWNDAGVNTLPFRGLAQTWNDVGLNSHPSQVASSGFSDVGVTIQLSRAISPDFSDVGAVALLR